MIPLTLAEIALATGGTLDRADPNTVVDGPLCFDSRNVTSGGLFACLNGRRDGHEFAEQGFKDGTVAAIATRAVGTPAVIVLDVLTAMADVAREVAIRYTGTIFGITGSAGKTSTKDLLSTILELNGPTVANPRSFNNEIGFPVTVTSVQPDTRYLVLEMGARGRGHIASLCDVAQPAIAVVLGIGSAHIGEFGSRNAIAEAKAEIVRALPTHGTAVLNTDDLLVSAMADHAPGRVLTFGQTPGSDVRATDISVGIDGRPHFALHHLGQHTRVQLALHGRHNVTNALAAAAAALAANAPFDLVAQGLSQARLTSGGRMEVLERPDSITVINDAFNASPESVLAALAALQDIAHGERRTIAVLGQMAELGDDTHAWHERVGRAAADTGVSRLIVVGDEQADTIARAFKDAGGANVTKADDPQMLTDMVGAVIQTHDVLLVKGSNSLGLEAIGRQLSGQSEHPKTS